MYNIAGLQNAHHFYSDPIEFDLVILLRSIVSMQRDRTSKSSPVTCRLSWRITRIKHKISKRLILLSTVQLDPREVRGDICSTTCWLLQAQRRSCLWWNRKTSTSQFHLLADMSFLHFKNISWHMLKEAGECFTACTVVLLYCWLTFSSFIQTTCNWS